MRKPDFEGSQYYPGKHIKTGAAGAFVYPSPAPERGLWGCQDQEVSQPVAACGGLSGRIGCPYGKLFSEIQDSSWRDDDAENEDSDECDEW